MNFFLFTFVKYTRLLLVSIVPYNTIATTLCGVVLLIKSNLIAYRSYHLTYLLHRLKKRDCKPNKKRLGTKKRTHNKQHSQNSYHAQLASEQQLKRTHCSCSRPLLPLILNNGTLCLTLSQPSKGSSYIIIDTAIPCWSHTPSSVMLSSVYV